MKNSEVIALKSEIKAMYKYLDRKTFNVKVLHEMCKQITTTVEGLFPPQTGSVNNEGVR